MLTIALIEPKIPQNTGTIARLCAANNLKLDLVGPLGFSLDDKQLKRAGLDYWPEVNWEHHSNTEHYMRVLNPNKIHLLTTKTDTSYTDHEYNTDDILLFGSETEGIAETYRKLYSGQCCTIPMENPAIRSLNLAVSVGIVTYNALTKIKNW